MSAPDTNLKKQKKRHIGPLIGIAVVLALVAVLGFSFLGSADPEAADPQPGATAPEAAAPIPGEAEPATPLDAPEGQPRTIEPAPAPGAD